jgi:hypothetical protein
MDNLFKINEQAELVNNLPALNVDIARDKLKLYSVKVDQLVEQTQAFKIDSELTNQNAVAFLGQLKSVGKDLEKKRDQIIDEPAQFVKAVRGLVKAFTDKLDTAEKSLKEKVLSYQKVLELKRQEQEALARKETEKLQKKLDAEVKKKGLEAVELPIPIIPKVPPVTRTETGSAFTRKFWTFKLIDANLVPRKYLVPSDTKIRDAIKGGIRDIPGLEIYEEESLTVRR